MRNIRRFLISIGKHILEKNPSARNLSKGRSENFANLFAVKDFKQESSVPAELKISETSAWHFIEQSKPA